MKAEIPPRLDLASLWYEIVGIDVSHHQGLIDWPAVRASGVRFVYMKATEGETFKDTRFQENWRLSAGVGLARGAYHFFTQCRTGTEQAANFIDSVPVDAAALPPAIDIEHMGPCKERPMVADVAAEIRTMIDMLDAHYGKRPILYTTREFHDAHLAGRFDDEQFWIRSLVIPPRFRTSQWVIWQYHNNGRRAGIDGPVDLNVFRGTEEDFTAFVGG